MVGGLLIGVAGLAMGNSAAPVASADRSGGQIDGPLQALARQQPTRTVRVIVQAPHRGDAEAAIRQKGGQVYGHLPQVAGVSAELTAGSAIELAQQHGVVRVLLDPPMRTVTEARDSVEWPSSVYPQAIGAAGLWSTGVLGRGVAVAVLDSGIQPHADLGTPSRVVFNERFNPGASSSADQYGHGTWVAGIAAGEGTASRGRFVGVAPQASLVNLKVSDDQGRAYASDVIQALGWVAANASTYHIRVVNLSFVSSVAESYTTNLLDAAVEMVWHAGVVVVVSAGNAGANTEHYAPANDPYVITVGASDDHGSASPLDDTLAWFSSFGLTQAGHSKPDLVAPGRHIVGLLASSGAGLATQFPSKVVNQRYIQLSGTSAAAPVVAGAVALLLEAHPKLTPDEVKWLLTHTARPINAQSGIGSGQLDVLAASSFGGPASRANQGLRPNWLVAMAYLSQQQQSSGVGTSASWDSVSWDSVSWDSVSWDSVSWDSVSWDSVSWDSVSWDSVSWDSVLGDD
jgi:serine protease AprX